MSLFDATVTLLSGPLARTCLRPLMRGRATVFMLHRLDDPSLGIHGHSVEYVRSILDTLKRSGAEFVSLRRLIESYRGEGPGANWVAFTIDDGFADQAILAKSGFIDAGCPVTVFLISGFLDGKIWPWDDQVSYVLRKSPLTKCDVSIAGEKLPLNLQTLEDRHRAIEIVRARMKGSSNSNLYELVVSLAAQVQVDLPRDAPSEFKPMTWDEARVLEGAGVDFGPHSVTHRIFSRLTDAEAGDEIRVAWARLQSELKNPLPVMAWPTGGHAHFTARDVALARAAGLQGAFATNSDYSHYDPASGNDDALYSLCRFSLPYRVRDVLQYGSWIERGKQVARRFRKS